MSGASEAHWGPQNWCEALAARFFGSQSAQLPVLFFIDEDLLVDLHPSRDKAVAVESLSRAVRSGLVQPLPNGYFAGLERQGQRWKLAGGEGTPPFLHLLAVCVLAATRMGTGKVAPSNYRHHLCTLLGLNDAEMPAGFRASLYYLWDTLTWWLDVRNSGALGISTVVEDKRFTHIGYPISQTLFRRSDARQLDDFFRWIGLRPGEEIDDDILVAHFRAWAPGQGLSAGAVRMLAEPQFDAAIARILAAYARHWDGTRSDTAATRCATLRIVVRAHPSVSLGLLALQPEGYPERLQGASGGRNVTASAEDGVFAVRGEVEPRMLVKGLRLGAGECQLLLEGAHVHTLRLDADLGGWASVSFIEPGERHWILVSPEERVDVLAQLDRTAQDPGRSGAGPDALRNWTVVRNVVFDGAAELSGALASQRPTHRHRLTLRGGLPLASPGAYLEGGAPDLWLPTVSEGGELIPRLDGAPLSAQSEQIRLADQIEPSGGATHVVEWAGVKRSFMTVVSARRIPPEGAVPTHALDLDAEGHVTAHRAATAAGDGAVRVRGALVDGPGARWRHAPVLLNRGAQNAWLIGAASGDVVAASVPRTPVWLRRAGLYDRLYEARADFEVAWVVERWKLAPELKIRAVAALEPRSGTTGPAEHALWHELLRNATLMSRDEGIRTLLDRYRQLSPDTASPATLM
jgi:hypothetical protein